jgi:pyruvate kinase
MRHTKIIATIGPTSNTPAIIEQLIAAGVNVFRLNFSHGTHDGHAEAVERVRAAARHCGQHVAIMQDLSGPKIRTGTLAGGKELQLRPGDELCIAEGDLTGGPGRVYTRFGELIRSARAGDRLLLDDGRIELRVTTAAPQELVTTVVHGGPLGEHKGINAPGVTLPASALTPKDIDDLRFGLSLGVDLVALSFVQTPDDVRLARSFMDGRPRPVPLIAKIERPAAVSNLTAILSVAQGVMVARGDLGLELPLEQVPRVQKEIIRCARTLGRPVIVATQVLDSMRVEPRPTRAEVSDAAKAVDEGVDAIMLSGETAAGAYPVRAVETLDLVIRDAESVPTTARFTPELDPGGLLHSRALCEAAVTLATTGHADAIVAVTREGKTARLLSALRPGAPIFAATPHASIASALALCWGVTPILSEHRDIAALEALVISQRLIAPGAVVVFISVQPDLSRSDTNFLHVHKLATRPVAS